ncbi:hypothetical protein DFH11DRAFT_1542749 [Phellopilus nigrolimitatus]|nr:hypothetical protein DFH11DRAFT_1542749 [Phellopilus nigrolimitatus]
MSGGSEISTKVADFYSTQLIANPAVVTLDKEASCQLMSTMIIYMICAFKKKVKYFWNRYIGLFAAVLNLHHYFPSGDDALRSTAHLVSIDSALNSTMLRQWFPAGIFEAWTHQIAGMIGILLIDFILLLRVLAFCSGDKKTSRRLLALFALEVVLMFAILLYIEISLQGEISCSNIGVVIDGLLKCGNNGVFHRNWATAYWVIPLAFELVLLGLIMREASKFWKTWQDFRGSRLVAVLIRDQVLYFLVVITCGVASMMSYWLGGGPFQSLVSGFTNASLPCVLGSRLLFNLHEAAEKGLNGGTSAEMAPANIN